MLYWLRKKAVVVVALLTYLFCVQATANEREMATPNCVVYVDQNATGANDGSSWSDAFLTIQDGIDAAAIKRMDTETVTIGIDTYTNCKSCSPYTPDNQFTDLGSRVQRYAVADYYGDTTACDVCACDVWVAQGTYSQNASLMLKTKTAVFGGFTGVETLRAQRDWLLNKTVLDGGGAVNHVVFAQNIYDSVLDGFTITGGQADTNAGTFPDNAGAGLFSDHASVQLKNCEFLGNQAHDGAGAYVYYTEEIHADDNSRFKPAFVNCAFDGNYASGTGGGITLFNTNAKLLGSIFLSNFGYMGGAVYTVNSTSNFDQCHFENNRASYGGGLYNRQEGGAAETLVTNSVFTQNQSAVTGNAVYNTQQANSAGISAPLILVHDTFYDNTSMGLTFPVYNEWDLRIYNSIFWDGGATEEFDTVGGYTSIADSVVQGSFSADSVSNVIGNDPEFIAPGSGDLRIKSSSPCVDAAPSGLGSGYHPVDYDGSSRTNIANPYSHSADIGAYEAPLLFNDLVFEIHVAGIPFKQNLSDPDPTAPDAPLQGARVEVYPCDTCAPQIGWTNGNGNVLIQDNPGNLPAHNVIPLGLVWPKNGERAVKIRVIDEAGVYYDNIVYRSLSLGGNGSNYVEDLGQWKMGRHIFVPMMMNLPEYDPSTFSYVDYDGDSVPDGLDLDHDGIGDHYEWYFGTDPNTSDSDEDGLADSWEVFGDHWVDYPLLGYTPTTFNDWLHDGTLNPPAQAGRHEVQPTILIVPDNDPADLWPGPDSDLLAKMKREILANLRVTQEVYRQTLQADTFRITDTILVYRSENDQAFYDKAETDGIYQGSLYMGALLAFEGKQSDEMDKTYVIVGMNNPNKRRVTTGVGGRPLLDLIDDRTSGGLLQMDSSHLNGEWVATSTFIHELGHTFGLAHGNGRTYRCFAGENNGRSIFDLGTGVSFMSYAGFHWSNRAFTRSNFRRPDGTDHVVYANGRSKFLPAGYSIGVDPSIGANYRTVLNPERTYTWRSTRQTPYEYYELSDKGTFLPEEINLQYSYNEGYFPNLTCDPVSNLKYGDMDDDYAVGSTNEFCPLSFVSRTPLSRPYFNPDGTRLGRWGYADSACGIYERCRLFKENEADGYARYGYGYELVNDPNTTGERVDSKPYISYYEALTHCKDALLSGSFLCYHNGIDITNDVPPDFQEPTTPADAYMDGDIVIYNGQVWISRIDNNMWIPDDTGCEACWEILWPVNIDWCPEDPGYCTTGNYVENPFQLEDDILSFEDVDLWTVTQGDAELTTNTNSTDGTASIEVSSDGWSKIESNPINTDAIDVTGSKLAFDLYMEDVSGDWLGTIVVFAHCPSANLYYQTLGSGQVAVLQDYPVGEWVTIDNFEIVPNVQAALEGSHEDFQFIIEFNSPVNPLAGYLLDNIRLVD